MTILYKAVRDTLYSIFNETFKYNKKSKKLVKYVSKVVKTPGFIAFLHTFGRDLKWNPHIHVLIAEIELCSNGLIRKHGYFDFDALSKRFQTILLNLLEKEIGHSFKAEKSKCYKNHKNGFYRKKHKLHDKMVMFISKKKEALENLYLNMKFLF